MRDRILDALNKVTCGLPMPSGGTNNTLRIGSTEAIADAIMEVLEEIENQYRESVALKELEE